MEQVNNKFEVQMFKLFNASDLEWPHGMCQVDY
jgi:hypothetical protein